MPSLLTLICLIAAVASAESGVVTGRVLDRRGRGVPHARVRAFHAVPLLEYPPPGTWNGLLGEAYSDSRGHFSMHTSSRGSVDHLLVEGAGHYNVVFSPFPPTVRVVLSRRILPPEAEFQRQMKKMRDRLRRKTPNCR